MFEVKAGMPFLSQSSFLSLKETLGSIHLSQLQFHDTFVHFSSLALAANKSWQLFEKKAASFAFVRTAHFSLLCTVCVFKAAVFSQWPPHKRRLFHIINIGISRLTVLCRLAEKSRRAK